MGWRALAAACALALGGTPSVAAPALVAGAISDLAGLLPCEAPSEISGETGLLLLCGGPFPSLEVLLLPPPAFAKARAGSTPAGRAAFCGDDCASADVTQARAGGWMTMPRGASAGNVVVTLVHGDLFLEVRSASEDLPAAEQAARQAVDLLAPRLMADVWSWAGTQPPLSLLDCPTPDRVMRPDQVTLRCGADVALTARLGQVSEAPDAIAQALGGDSGLSDLQADCLRQAPPCAVAPLILTGLRGVTIWPDVPRATTATAYVTDGTNLLSLSTTAPPGAARIAIDRAVRQLPPLLLQTDRTEDRP